MSEVRCVLYESAEAARAAGGGSIPDGAMWPDDEADSPHRQAMLAPYYHAHNAHRPSLFVKLPGECGWFAIDWKASMGGQGWEVTGEPPNLTVRPSIKVSIPAHDGHPEQELWHGYLTDGVLKPC